MPTLARAAALLTAVALVGACDTDDGRDLRAPTDEEREAMPTTTTTTTSLPGLPLEDVTTSTGPTTTAVPAFALQLPWAPGGPIDVRFTCDGEDRSPLLVWSAPPAGTVELALLVTDDDADSFVHWVVAGIAPTAGENGEGARITGAVEGVNDFGRTGWAGPCPPAGAPHTYRFRLYALSQQPELPDGFTGADLQAIAGPAAVAVAESTGTYASA